MSTFINFNYLLYYKLVNKELIDYKTQYPFLFKIAQRLEGTVRQPGIHACGVVWGLVGALVPFFYFNLLLAPAAGYAIGEVVSLAVNRKRGRGLATVAAIAVVISYLVSLFFNWGLPFGMLHILLGLLALALGIFVAVTRLR